jgi:hypothetical protein
MANPLQPIDTAKGSIIDGLKGIALRYLRQQIMAKLIEAAPWLFGRALGWMANPLVGFAIDTFLGFLLDKTILGVALVWIATDVQYDVKSAEDATAKLKAIFEHPEAYTEREMKEAEANFDEEAVELITIGMGRV